MPCRSEPDYPDNTLKVNVAEEQAKKRINTLTRMLCTLLNAVQNKKLDLSVDLGIRTKDTNELLKWSANHEEWDRKRLKEARQRALKKLSEEELEALGLAGENQNEE